MSLDASLRTSGNLATKRSVLKRHERLEILQASKGYDPKKQKVIGLPKTRVKK